MYGGAGWSIFSWASNNQWCRRLALKKEQASCLHQACSYFREFLAKPLPQAYDEPARARGLAFTSCHRLWFGPAILPV